MKQMKVGPGGIGTLVMLAAATSCTSAGVVETPPNILVILADDMGYGDVAAFHPPSQIPTPHLDRLAAEGIRFLDGHSPSGVCTPTRYGLLTGRYCWRTRLTSGVLGGYSPPLLDPDRSTIATMLRRQGYRTGAVGKWHLGMQLPVLDESADRSQWAGDPGIDFGGVISDSPIHHGFDRYFGVSASLDMAPYVYIKDDRFTAQPNAQQGALRFPHFARQGPRAEDFQLETVLDRLVDEAIGFLRESATEGAPFFLYLPLTAPHKPTMPHPRFRGATALGEYGDFVHQVDDSVGRVLAALEELDLAARTLVVYTSDNGSYMFRTDDAEATDHVDDPKQQRYRADRHRANGPFRGTKADIYDGGHHVPLIVRWPGRVAAGASCGTPVCLTDLYATFADVVGAKIGVDEAEDSCSLLALLEGQDDSRGAPVVHHSAGGMFAIRDGRWKLILGNGSGGRENPKGKPFEGPYQLYDLLADPAESRDLATEKPAIVARLTEDLARIRASGRSVERAESR